MKLTSPVVWSLLVPMIVAGIALKEPECFSRYDWDYKMLSQLVKLEQDTTAALNVLQQKVDNLKQTVSDQDQTIRDQKKTMRDQEKTIRSQEEALDKQEKLVEEIRKVQEVQERTLRDQKETVRNQVEAIEQQEKLVEQLSKEQEAKKDDATLGGSMYVRWGRTTCPGNGTEMVYSGYAGGSHYTHTGAAANTLCFPSDPLWGYYDDSMSNQAPVYGAEYQISGSLSQKLFKKNIYNHDIPCAVCRSPRSSTMMIPARNACYPGWTIEYTGYLIAGHKHNTAATEFVCLDIDPELVPFSSANKDEKLFYLAEASCGSLKCPPYVNGRELTCVVCSH